MSAATDGDDHQRLVRRLRDLAQVEIGALLAGVAENERDQLLASHVADLEDAVSLAGSAMESMREELGRGLHPLAWLEASGRGAPEELRSAARSSAERLVARAALCRRLAVLAEATAAVLPRLAAGASRRGE